MGGSDRCHSPGGQRSPSARGLSETGRPVAPPAVDAEAEMVIQDRNIPGITTLHSNERRKGNRTGARRLVFSLKAAVRKHSSLSPSVSSHRGGGCAHPNGGLGRKGRRGGPGRPRLCPGKLLSRLLLPQARYRRPFRLGHVPADS